MLKKYIINGIINMQTNGSFLFLERNFKMYIDKNSYKVWTLENEFGRKYVFYSKEKPSIFIFEKLMVQNYGAYKEVKERGLDKFKINIIKDNLSKQEAVEKVVEYCKKLNPVHKIL